MKRKTIVLTVILFFAVGLVFTVLAIAKDDVDEPLSCNGKCKLVVKECLAACDKVNKNINDVCHINCMGDLMKCKSKCPK